MELRYKLNALPLRHYSVPIFNDTFWEGLIWGCRFPFSWCLCTDREVLASCSQHPERAVTCSQSKCVRASLGLSHGVTVPLALNSVLVNQQQKKEAEIGPSIGEAASVESNRILANLPMKMAQVVLK